MGGSELGGRWRDIPVPIIMGIVIGFLTTWWVGLLSVGSYQIIRRGYGIPDDTDEGSSVAQWFWSKGIKVPWVVRGTVGSLYGLIGGINVFIYLIFTSGSKFIILYFLYVFINFSTNAIGEKMKWKDYVVEPLAGLGVSSLVFFL